VSIKRAAEKKTTTRYAYVQSSLMWGKGGGISLADLRDVVAATEDYDPHSRVILEPNKVSVTETLETPWEKRGRDE
jgi:hypothetical protein